MQHLFKLQNLVLSGVLLGVVLLGYVIFMPECTTIGAVRPQMGSQGYRTWSGESLKTFTHSGNKICIPPGWAPLGEDSAGDGWVVFPAGVTGVLYKTDSFSSQTILPAESEYQVELLHSTDLPPQDSAAYRDMVESAFDQVGSLYNDSPKDLRQKHSILVTAGLAGDTRSSETRVYPDPTRARSFIVRGAGDARGEELLVHAVVHLYNRHALVGTEYTAVQAPFSAEEFQELEATWAELALNTNVEGVRLRLLYLYQVHSAVMTRDFSLIPGPPFNDETGFSLIRPTIFVPSNGGYLEFQYGHYILAPLVMAAADALLSEAQTGTTVADLIKEVHTTDANLITLLTRELGEQQVSELMAYARGEQQIPYPLVERAKRLYTN
jgi:hypothetical protein